MMFGRIVWPTVGKVLLWLFVIGGLLGVALPPLYAIAKLRLGW